MKKTDQLLMFMNHLVRVAKFILFLFSIGIILLSIQTYQAQTYSYQTMIIFLTSILSLIFLFYWRD